LGTEKIKEALVENLVKNTSLSIEDANSYITRYKSDIRQVYSQKKSYLVHRIRTGFEEIYTEILEKSSKEEVKANYLKIEEKWHMLCSRLDLTTSSDKAFAKLIIELYCEDKDLTSIPENDILKRYTFLLNGKVITDEILASNKRKRNKPQYLKRHNRAKKHKIDCTSNYPSDTNTSSVNTPIIVPSTTQPTDNPSHNIIVNSSTINSLMINCLILYL